MNRLRQIIANRENAAKSCGPTSREGKARASLNARRHGLSARDLASDDHIAERKALAFRIAGGNDDAEAFTVAQEIAAAQLDLDRIARVREDCIRRGGVAPPAPAGRIKKGKKREAKMLLEKIDITQKSDRPIEDKEAILLRLTNKVTRLMDAPVDMSGAESVNALVTELLKIERYEQRALARQRNAIRKYEALSDKDK